MAYVLVVFGTKFLMRNRPPFSLFVPLNAWNLFLAVFSSEKFLSNFINFHIICLAMGAIKLAPEFFGTIWNHGFQSEPKFRL